MHLRDFQKSIESMYGDKDRARGPQGTFMYLVEEVGELATAIQEGDRGNLGEEFADVQAWLASLAGLMGVDLQEEVEKKYDLCSGCGQKTCRCNTKGGQPVKNKT